MKVKPLSGHRLRRKTMSNSRRGALTLCCLAICAVPTLHGVALAEGTACKYVSQLPDDCAGAVLRKYDNLRNYRYRRSTSSPGM